MLILEGILHTHLRQFAIAASPREAVGLILSDLSVVRLPNYASAPEHQFKVAKNDILNALGDEENLDEVVFWHSHPMGGLGPSRLDMKHKTLFNHHLVLSVVENDIVPSWY